MCCVKNNKKGLLYSFSLLEVFVFCDLCWIKVSYLRERSRFTLIFFINCCVLIFSIDLDYSTIAMNEINFELSCSELRFLSTCTF